jgi:monoterpene epsilon-lactone hydrolase
MPANERATGGREPRHYEIRVRGLIGLTLMQAFPALTTASIGPDTLLTGSLPDQSALYGVIHQLEALGLELLGIRCLPTSVRPDVTDQDATT